MQTILLKVTEFPGRKSGRFTYQAVNDGQVIYETVTDRVYFAITLKEGYKGHTGRTENARPDIRQMVAVNRYGRQDLFEKAKIGDMAQVQFVARIDFQEPAIPVITYQTEPVQGNHRGVVVILADGEKVGTVNPSRDSGDTPGCVADFRAVKDFCFDRFPGGFILPYSVDEFCDASDAVTREAVLRPWMVGNASFERAVAAIAAATSVKPASFPSPESRLVPSTPAPTPEGRYSEWIDQSETYHLYDPALAVNYDITPEDHRELYRAFEAGADFANVKDVDFGLEHVVNLKQMFEATKLQVGGRYTITQKFDTGENQALEGLTYRGGEFHKGIGDVIDTFVDDNGVEVLVERGFFGLSTFLKKSDVLGLEDRMKAHDAKKDEAPYPFPFPSRTDTKSAAIEGNRKSMEQMGQIAKIAHQMAEWLTKEGVSWESAEPIFTRALEIKLRAIAKESISEHSIPSSHA